MKKKENIQNFIISSCVVLLSKPEISEMGHMEESVIMLGCMFSSLCVYFDFTESVLYVLLRLCRDILSELKTVAHNNVTTTSVATQLHEEQ